MGLTSLQRRDLYDQPAASLSDPGTPPVLAAAAAIIAGEPRRALRELDSAGPTARSAPDWAALRTLASALDVNWWPGDIGAIHHGGTPNLEQPDVNRTGNDRADLLFAVVSQVQPQLLSLRTIIRASVRVDPASSATAVPGLTQEIRALLGLAAKIDVVVAASVAVELADLHRLGGLDVRAAEYLAWARQAYVSLDDPAGQARCLLVQADWLIAPATFTETLGFDLEDFGYVPPAPAAALIDSARDRYQEARALFRTAHAVRGEAATQMRESYLDCLAGHPDRGERRLRAAARLCRQAGDGAAAHLADIHATLAAVAAGRLSAARPGPAADIVQWANNTGSASYGRGLGRLVHAAGHAWRVSGDIERARVTLMLAADLATALSSVFTQREVLSELGDLFQAINSIGPAIASYQRALSDRLAEADGADATPGIKPMTWLEIAELVTSMFKLYLSARNPGGMARTAALARRLLAGAPDGIAVTPSNIDVLGLAVRERDEISRLSADRVTAAPGSKPAADFEQRVFTLTAEALAFIVSQADVFVPLHQARAHQRDGDDARAGTLFAKALARARGQGNSARSLQAIVLGVLGRYEEAQIIVAQLLRDVPGVEPDDVVGMWAAAQAYGKAAAAIQALPSSAKRGWRALTQLGTVCAGAGDIDAAEEYLTQARAAFEHSVSGVARDAFRTSITNDPAARDLYTVAASVALRQHRTGDAFALTDRLRSLALSELLRDVAHRSSEQPERSEATRRWAQASATWTGAYDLLAAAGNSGDIERIRPAQDSLDAAQLRLDTAEERLETALPGRLLRGRRTNAPPIRLEQVQQLMPDDALLVEYLVGWDRIMIWAVDRHGATASEIAFDTVKLSGLVRRFHSFCARRRGADNDRDARGPSSCRRCPPVLVGSIHTYRRVERECRLWPMPHRASITNPDGIAAGSAE